MSLARFDELWNRYLDAELTAAEYAELERRFDQDASLIRAAADRYEEHRHLGFILQDVDRESFAQDVVATLQNDQEQFARTVSARLSIPAKQRPWNRFAGYVVAVGLTLLISAMVFRFSSNPAQPRAAGVPSDYLATLAALQDAVWSEGQSWSADDRLTTGRMVLEKGSAVIRMDQGATMFITAPCDFEIESAESVVIHMGKANVRAPEEAVGFTVRAPPSDFIDWGTEFTVSVEAEGATEIHVHEGLVESVSRQGDTSRMVHGGSAIRFAQADSRDAEAVSFSKVTFPARVDPLLQPPQLDRITAFEGFSNNLRNSPKGDGDFGWKGRWVRGGFWNSEPVKIAANLNVTAPPAMRASQGGSLVLDPRDHLVFKRMLDTPVEMGREGTIYFSFLLHRPRDLDQSRQWFAFILSNRENRRLALRTGFHHDGRAAIFARGDGQSLRDFQPGAGTILFVGRISSSSNRPDRCFVKIYREQDPLDLQEPTDWTVTTRPFHQSESLDLVAIAFDQAPGMRLDEIRFGTSWSAVVPSALDLESTGTSIR